MSVRLSGSQDIPLPCDTGIRGALSIRGGSSGGGGGGLQIAGKKISAEAGIFSLVPKRGFESTRLYPPVPENSASTKSTAWAARGSMLGD